MNKFGDISKRVEETLNSLDGIRRAEPQPYFYTRLIARLQRNDKTLWESLGSFIARPAIAVASLCIILAFNAFMLLRQDSSVPVTVKPNDITNTTLMTDNEYILASSSSFDYENFDQQ
jgi:hypothetical protein